MSLQACLTSCYNSVQYKVKDMTQADFGRLEIELAEAEMPGLIACRSACTRMPLTCRSSDEMNTDSYMHRFPRTP